MTGARAPETGRRGLVLAPHTDDGELGAGATVARLVEEGGRVCILAFSTGHPSRGSTHEEALAAAAALGVAEPGGRVHFCNLEARRFPERRQEILEAMIWARGAWEPDLVFCPSSFDRHQDHQAVHAEAIRAFPRVTLLGYELPWGCRGFHATCLWPVERGHVEAKLRALACYQSQARYAYVQPAAIWGLATVRGLGLGLDGQGYAEGYEVLQWVSK
jgi:LmbE family N-acetylglucosaminyl deacetylase